MPSSLGPILLGLILLAALVTGATWITAFLYRRYLAKRHYSDTTRFLRPHSQFLTVDGVKLHYIVEGEGPDIFLIHGIGANIFVWRYLIPLLSKNYRVWAIDLMGHGLSDKPRRRSYGAGAQAALLAKLMDDLGISQCLLVGNSMGGAIGAELTIQRPDLVRDLVLLSSCHDPRIVGALDLRRISFLTDLITPFAGRTLIREFMRRLYGKKHQITPEELEAYLWPFMNATDSHHAFIASFEALIDPTLVPRLKGINKRVLILWGKNDKLTPVKYGEQLLKDLPSSMMHIHPEAGHHVQEEEPQWLAQHIDSFASSRNLKSS